MAFLMEADVDLKLLISFGARKFSVRLLITQTGCPRTAKRGHLAVGVHNPSKPHTRAAAHSPTHARLQSERRVMETHPCLLVAQSGCTALRTRTRPMLWCSLYIRTWLRYGSTTSAVPAFLWFILALLRSVCTQPKPLHNSSLPVAFRFTDHPHTTTPFRQLCPHRPRVFE